MILDRLAAAAHHRVDIRKNLIPLPALKRKASQTPAKGSFPFEQALRGPDLKFICELKQASPSRGSIVTEFPYLQLAREYERAGAAAISVLTEPEFFLGRDEHLAEVSSAVDLPVLRKDFIVDEYQLYEAKTLGAAAVLLICALLDSRTVQEYLAICDKLGLSALVETHDEREVDSALRAGARVIGVNNRNLHDFSVDMNNSLNLRALVPDHILFVAESGINNAVDVARLRDRQVNGVLIGEALMMSRDKCALLNELRGEQ